tara:strand:- start:9260 stop:9799 length:540 start_codon:yes stop_codon:yes gene_type:complete
LNYEILHQQKEATKAKEAKAKDQRQKIMAAKVPKKYTSGLSESTAAKRKAEIRKRIKGKKADRFKPLPGDSKKTRRRGAGTIKATRSGVRDRIIEEAGKLSGSTKSRFISATASVTGAPRAIIKKVYERGEAAWAVGHRPGATQSQWARARVYGFITGGKSTRRGMPDHSLYQEAKKSM